MANRQLLAANLTVEVLAAILGIALILFVLWDTVETILLPRTVARRFGITSIFNRGLGKLYAVVGDRMSGGSPARERLLGSYGPLSLILLIAFWAGLLIVGFAAVHWGLHVPLTGTQEGSGLGEYLYMSAITFYTLGYGDVTPVNATGRFIAVFEAGTGFGFLALVIGYVPVLYGQFSRRESTILLLDARAGSPPTASELLCRYSKHGLDSLEDLLAELERWGAALLESYLSYPLLAFYRSQHEKLTWLGALTMSLDACSILRLTCESDKAGHARLLRQAELTYAMSRHVIVDLAFILGVPPSHVGASRLPRDAFEQLCLAVHGDSIRFTASDELYTQLSAIRREYEPYLEGLSHRLYLPIPPWMPEKRDLDGWQISAWDEDSKHFQAENGDAS